MFTAKNGCKMLTIKAMVKKDGLRVDRNYNVKFCFYVHKEGEKAFN